MTNAVRAVLRRGLVESRLVFPDNGPAREIEVWRTPDVRGDGELEAVREHLDGMKTALAPAERGELLARILALLSHYRLDPHPEQVEMRIADDWAEDLGGYPMWAIEEAAKFWRRTRKWKPQICEIIALCEEAVGQHLRIRDRLRAVVERAEASANPLSGYVDALSRRMFQRMPAEAGD
ncbi:MAG TPA: hypothetical protein VIL69_13345 [Roseomonas sp.]|jgi:hypothetical protein